MEIVRIDYLPPKQKVKTWRLIRRAPNASSTFLNLGCIDNVDELSLEKSTQSNEQKSKEKNNGVNEED